MIEENEIEKGGPIWSVCMQLVYIGRGDLEREEVKVTWTKNKVREISREGPFGDNGSCLHPLWTCSYQSQIIFGPLYLPLLLQASNRSINLQAKHDLDNC